MRRNIITFTLLIFVGLTSCKKDKPSDLVNQENATHASNQETNTKETAPTDAPTIEFTKLEHDFGTIEFGKKVNHDFAFTNTGKSPLVIQKVTPSCGCTVPETPKEPFSPGETGKISVVYNPKNHNGIQGSSVTVASNTTKGTDILKIKANVVNAPGGQQSNLTATPGGPVAQ